MMLLPQQSLNSNIGRKNNIYMHNNDKKKSFRIVRIATIKLGLVSTSHLKN